MLNRAQIIGHVGADPETGTTQSGKRWARFNIATSEKWTDKATGEKKEATEWHQIGVWGDDLIEKLVIPYVKKGSKLFVEGKITTQKYTDEKGIERYSTRIVVQGLEGRITLLDKPEGTRRENAPMQEPQGRSSGGNQASSNGASHQNGAGYSKQYDDQIPF